MKHWSGQWSKGDIVSEQSGFDQGKRLGISISSSAWTAPQEKKDLAVTGNSAKATWVADAMRQAQFDAMADLAALAASFYKGALAQGLTPDGAKAVTEATLTALMRTPQPS